MLVQAAAFLEGRLGVLSGDITEYRGEALVNAANSGLAGGGGVDGAIHRAAGPDLLEACMDLRAGPLRSGLPAGQAVATLAGRLSVRRVIHTVGPIWRGGAFGERATLASCYASALALAEAEDIETVAIPAISTGVYGYPKAEALMVAALACREFLRTHALPRRVDLVFFRSADAENAVRTLPRILADPPALP